MSAEDQINMLNQIPPQSNFEMKRARKTALVLATTTIISILFLIYAFLQKKEADKQAVIAVEMKMEAEKQREIAEASREMAVLAQQEAERQRILADKALADCERNKRK
jgi:hypothetical protein